MPRTLPTSLCLLAALSLSAQTPRTVADDFSIAEGYQVTEVTTREQLNSPVAIAWDAFERLWVLESPETYGALDVVRASASGMGAISFFEDTDGDGQLDKRVIFADNLVRPSTFCPAYGGVLAIIDAQLIWMGDRDGDGRCDLREVVATDLTSPASQGGPIAVFDTGPAGLRQGIDNWFYIPNHNRRYRLRNGAWEQEPTTAHNTFGFAEDDWGRQLFAGEAGHTFATHLPALGMATGNLLDDRLSSPLEWTPQTTYFGFESFTGTRLQQSDRGSLFALNLWTGNVTRIEITESEGRLGSGDKTPILSAAAGTEPHSPRQLATGPDGALYLCARSVLRITHKDVYDTRAMYDNRVLGHASSLELCASLGSANGWRRRTAQRLLIERGLGFGRTADALLLSLETLAKGGLPQGRLHALWTLEGLGLLTPKLLLEAFKVEKEPHLLAVLVRLSANHLSAGKATVEQRSKFLRAFEKLTRSDLQRPPLAPDPGAEPIHLGGLESSSTSATPRANLAQLGKQTTLELHLARWQLAASLDKLEGSQKAMGALSEQQLKIVRQLLAGRGDDQLLIEGILGSLQGRELHLFNALGESGLLSPTLATALGQTLARTSLQPEFRATLGNLCNLASRHESKEVLRGARAIFIEAGYSAKTPFETRLPFPTGLATALAYEAHPLHAEANELAPLLAFVTPPAPARNIFGKLPLSGEELALFNKQVERGEVIYNMICAACHMPGGEGLDALGPPLLASGWLERDDKKLASIVLHGLEGEIKVLGKTWNMAMPSWASLSDRELADCLTYVRATFGEEPVRQAAITEETLRKVRAETPR